MAINSLPTATIYGSNQIVMTTNGNSGSVPQSTPNAGIFEYSLVSVKDGSLTQCSQNQSGTATISVNNKPTITLSVNGQTLNEGNTQVLCDTDANPINGLQFTLAGSCVVGNPVWRVQVVMYANREGFTELYAQNHPLYGFYQDNGSGGNTYDAGLPKGLYKLSIRYWDQKGQGSIYPATRQPAGNVLAYQEYWFRIQSQNGVGTGAARTAL